MNMEHPDEDGWENAVKRAIENSSPPRLVTRSDWESLPGVVLVRDCWPESGHITLLIKRAYRSDLREFIRRYRPANLIVHLESVSGYNKFEEIVP